MLDEGIQKMVTEKAALARRPRGFVRVNGTGWLRSKASAAVFCSAGETALFVGGTGGSNPSSSSAESAANFVFGREAWKGPRRRQGTIPTVSTSSGTDGSSPAPSCKESTAKPDADLILTL